MSRRVIVSFSGGTESFSHIFPCFAKPTEASFCGFCRSSKGNSQNRNRESCAMYYIDACCANVGSGPFIARVFRPVNS